MSPPLNVTGGMLYFLIKAIRPRLAQKIEETERIETLVIGLGGQGEKHAGLMQSYGTHVAACVAPGRGGTRVHETIPVYDTVRECLALHPHIAAASVWRHHATAAEAAIEAIGAGIPLVVLISEGIPLKDVRDILAAARRKNTLLIGGNTPGLIFPPERIKIGMLPDVFYPEETSPGVFGFRGVTIISRSGAILYHMSDAMASCGIAQNAVIGIGGDGAVGATFRDLVPLAMAYENTDLVIAAGEIGGCQEELLAQDIKAHPERYPKPLVALVSGACAPEGKTMGHAGAIITPGMETGTFRSKKEALEKAGVPVVNSQLDLIEAVRGRLGGKTYFDPERYYRKMRTIWEAPVPKPSWSTAVTDVKPNSLVLRGYPLPEIIRNASLEEAAFLAVSGELPDASASRSLRGIVQKALDGPVPKVAVAEGEDISKSWVKFLLCDDALAHYSPAGSHAAVHKTLYCLGRSALYLARLVKKRPLSEDSDHRSLASLLSRILGGNTRPDPARARMLEAMIVASIDHGVTPPSAQATRIAATVRAPYEVAIGQGIGAITDVHGGAGEKAALFFLECAHHRIKTGLPLADAVKAVASSYVRSGKRIEGMGHRIHTEDPRRDILYSLAEKAGIAGECVAASRIAGPVVKEIRGIDLPVNVDGVIGAIVADMGLEARLAKAIFIFGRISGLSAHYFEEIMTQASMRPIRFQDAVYTGPALRSFGSKRKPA